MVSEFDIYDLLRKGDKSHDVPLLPGDVIYIPSIGPQIAVLGSVNEPGIYELKSDTTTASILKDVAGLTNLANFLWMCLCPDSLLGTVWPSISLS